MTHLEQSLMQQLHEADKVLAELSERTQRALEHRRELIHRNSMNKNPAFADYFSRMDD